MARSALGGRYTVLRPRNIAALHRRVSSCTAVHRSDCRPHDSVALRNVERMRLGKARITLSRPGDLLGVVPYLVGFHPEESVVAVMLRSGRVVLTIRVDVPPTSGAADLAGQIARLVAQHGAQHLLLIGYSINPQVRELLMEMAWELTPSGLQDVLFVDGQRWWSLMCTSGCCPSDGQPYDPRSSPVAAQAV